MTLMQQEIHQQPETIRAVAYAEVEPARCLAQAMGERDIKYAIIAARGTSDHAATYAQYLLGIENSLPVGLATPSVQTLYGRKVNYRDALVIGISQSGESPDVAEVVQSAREVGALTASITNNPNSLVARTAEFPLRIHSGSEKSVAATKTYMGTLAVIALLSELLKGSSDPVAALNDVADKMTIALKKEEQIARVVERYRYIQQCAILARGINWATASEAALKIIETSYVMARPYSSADFLHGPFALVHAGFPVMLFASNGPTLGTMHEIACKLRDNNAEIIAIARSKDILDTARTAIEVEFDIEEIYSPLVYIVYGQLFACHLAQTIGVDPDNPRGLTKVTRTL
jgi:glucosamine--fructose-6-phosphate aminotransferase (isomerizing)